MARRADGGLGGDTTDDPDLHLLVAGSRLEPTAANNGIYSFALEKPPDESLRLCSRCAVPSLLGINRHDHRRLGVAISRIELRQLGYVRRCFIHAARLFAEGGCHRAEPGYCWTDGALALAPMMFAGLSGPVTLVVHTKRPGMRYAVASVTAIAA